MVARLKLKGIDGRAPPGVEPEQDTVWGKSTLELMCLNIGQVCVTVGCDFLTEKEFLTAMALNFLF